MNTLRKTAGVLVVALGALLLVFGGISVFVAFFDLVGLQENLEDDAYAGCVLVFAVGLVLAGWALWRGGKRLLRPRMHRCKSCDQIVMPFRQPESYYGSVEGWMERMEPTLKPSHALVCSSCGELCCPVCLGKEAASKGLKVFVCPLCGHKPVNEFYRG